MPFGCKLDTDNDGNCPVHPGGCPRPATSSGRCRCGTASTKHRPSDLVCATCGMVAASDGMRPIDERTAGELKWCACGSETTTYIHDPTRCIRCQLPIHLRIDAQLPLFAEQRTAHNLRIDPSMLGDEVPLSQDSQDKVEAAMHLISAPAFDPDRARELADIVMAGGPRAANAAPLVAEQLRGAAHIVSMMRARDFTSPLSVAEAQFLLDCIETPASQFSLMAAALASRGYLVQDGRDYRVTEAGRAVLTAMRRLR